mmetsp:Transcript_18794/g.20910  ORF Transcript_18794/g.20910 Transcript_18794/m.20910 type:complete len:100 (+) Transcript_18794:105-404(+)
MARHSKHIFGQEKYLQIMDRWKQLLRRTGSGFMLFSLWRNLRRYGIKRPKFSCSVSCQPWSGVLLWVATCVLLKKKANNPAVLIAFQYKKPFCSVRNKP